MKCKIKVVDEVFCVLYGLTPSTTQLLWDHFAPYVDGHQFMPSFKLGRWDGRLRFYEKSNKTYVNLLYEIVPILEKIGYEVDLEDNRTFFKAPNKIDSDIFAKHGVILRPHQVIGVNELITAGGGFGIFPTNCGKTLMTAAMSKAFNDLDYCAITIVPSTDLVNQTYAWYVRCGLDVGKYCGTEKDIHHMSVVSTWQSLQNNPRILDKFRTIIWDEAHGVKGPVARELLTDHAKHAPFKFGVTGTMPKSFVDQMCLRVAVGDVITTQTSRWMMDNGFSTPVEIESYEMVEKRKEDFTDYNAEKAYLSRNKERLEVLADLIIDRCDAYGNTLVLVNSIQLGEQLANMIEGAVFLNGGTDTDTRKEHYDLFATEENLIRIATYGIASTGISIDRIMCLMMLDAGKSFVRAIQSIGRSLRQAEGKDIAHVIDVYSSLKWSKKHYKERRKYYLEVEYPITAENKLKIS